MPLMSLESVWTREEKLHTECLNGFLHCFCCSVTMMTLLCHHNYTALLFCSLERALTQNTNTRLESFLAASTSLEATAG